MRECMEKYILIFLAANIVATMTNLLVSVKLIKDNKPINVYLNSMRKDEYFN